MNEGCCRAITHYWQGSSRERKEIQCIYRSARNEFIFYVCVWTNYFFKSLALKKVLELYIFRVLVDKYIVFERQVKNNTIVLTISASVSLSSPIYETKINRAFSTFPCMSCCIPQLFINTDGDYECSSMVIVTLLAFIRQIKRRLQV